MSSRLGKLAVIATVAGAFSALFGVGGGSVIVPLLVLWLAYGEREATGTSLAAIVVIAGMAAIAEVIAGNVSATKAAVVGIPAIAGTLAGTALQQRVSERVVSGAFALLLIASAITLVV